MKRLLILTFLFIFITTSVFAAEFWASKGSNKYHYPECKWAQKINKKNLIKFSSPEDAIKAGYTPCKVCKPPEALKN